MEKHDRENILHRQQKSRTKEMVERGENDLFGRLKMGDDKSEAKK